MTKSPAEKRVRIIPRSKNTCNVRVISADEGLCELPRGHKGNHAYWIYERRKAKR